MIVRVQVIRFIVGMTVVIAAMTLTAIPASGHTRTQDGRWYFSGSTYNKDQDRSRPPQRANRTDPVTVIWRGPPGTTASVARALSHTQEHWRERYIPSRFPRGAFMKRRTANPACRDAQYIFMRRGNASRLGRWASSIAYMSTNGTCQNQYHIRMWSSGVHAGFFGTLHESEWVLAPIHHERVRISCGLTGSFPNFVPGCRPRHKIDLPWDQARYIYYRTQRRAHCVDPLWAIHPESQGQRYSNYRNSGIISRISFRHRSEGCGGA